MIRALLLVATLLLSACKSEPVRLDFSGETMGTTYNVIAIDASGDVDPDAVQAAIDAALAAVNGKMSNWNPQSEISLFNAQTTTDPVAISPELSDVMAAANLIHTESEGQFDVTLGPLIELWGFGARTTDTPLPADEDIAAALDIVGQTKVLTLDTDAGTLTKHLPDTSVYLAAIAKGWGVDQVADAVAGFGISDYMVEIGGDLVASGVNPEGTPWQIGIEKPDTQARTVQQVVSVSDHGMATSGDYRNYFEEDGQRYSHIIDATTGRPITHTTASVTVLAENAMLADGWATALLALGVKRGLEIAEANDLAVLFIERDGESDDLVFTTTATSQFQALQAEKE